MEWSRLCLRRKDQGKPTVSPALGTLEPMGWRWGEFDLFGPVEGQMTNWGRIKAFFTIGPVFDEGESDGYKLLRRRCRRARTYSSVALGSGWRLERTEWMADCGSLSSLWSVEHWNIGTLQGDSSGEARKVWVRPPSFPEREPITEPTLGGASCANGKGAPWAI